MQAALPSGMLCPALGASSTHDGPMGAMGRLSVAQTEGTRRMRALSVREDALLPVLSEWCVLLLLLLLLLVGLLLLLRLCARTARSAAAFHLGQGNPQAPRAGRRPHSRGELPALPLAALAVRRRRLAKQVAVAPCLCALRPERAARPAVATLWPQVAQRLERGLPQHDLVVHLGDDAPL